MEKRSEQPLVPAPLRPQTACWYQAATLTERIASQHAKAATQELSERSRSEEAEKMLQSWKAQKPFGSGSFFADRLAMDAITEHDLLALFMEPIEALQERLSQSTAPGWVMELVDSLQSDLVSPSLPEPDLERLFQQFVIVKPFYPLLRRSVSRFLAGVEVLSQHYQTLPFDPKTIHSLLLPHLLQQLQLQVSKTVVLELNIARLRGLLQGETPQSRFQAYLLLLSQREHLQPFLEEYSVLARQIVVSCQLWTDCSLEFLQRLCRDWQEILSVFSPEHEPGVLTEVAGGAGDTHRGGQSVMILTFRSGWRLTYKPRSLTVDVHFQELQAWLNVRGSHPAFRLLKLIDKATYGWAEFVVANSCSSKEEVARFYQRQGGYLALLYALEATDFHYENVIAVGEYPLLIDLEALFHHRPGREDAVQRPAQRSLEHSVLRSLLLPIRMFSNDDDEQGVDISGLTQVEGQLSLRPVPLWEGAGTDEMKLIRQRIKLQGGKNSPRLRDQEVQPLDYLEHIIAGFTTIYRLLSTYRDELLTTILPRFAGDEVRFVARDTRIYTVLLTESFYPNLLRDALRRERFFDHLWMAVEYHPSLPRLIPAERADLLQGDIPLFTTHPENRDLWTSRGESLPAFFEESSLELVSKRLQELNETDLRQQIWMIRSSFVSVKGQPVLIAKASRSDEYTPPVHFAVGRELLLAEAQAIGDHLCGSALQDEGCADWLGLTFTRNYQWQIGSLGLDLANGLPGILLFLSYLSSITGEARYADLAQAGLNTLRAFIKKDLPTLPAFYQGTNGAFAGLSSCFYFFSHLAVLWKDPSLLQEAEELIQQLPDRIEKDEWFNLVEGSAGCIVGLLNLYSLAPSMQTLKMAIRCGEHLLARAQPTQKGQGWKARQQNMPLAGFSQGTAGIAWSLFWLATVSGEERFRDAAVAAMTYERSLFSAQQRHWLDLGKQLTGTSRHPEQTEPIQTQGAHAGMSWLDGVPAIALGRLVSLPYLNDATMRTELEMALETMIAVGFGYDHEQVGSNHSLAHGDCGNLEIVLLAVQTLHTSRLQEHLGRLTSQVLENIHRHGCVSGTPFNLETPGLMYGLAGIGYELLRLAEPERVPSVLTLAPPPQNPW